MRRRRLNEDRINVSSALSALFGGRVAEINAWGEDAPGLYFIEFSTIMDWPDVRVEFNDAGKIKGFELIHDHTQDSMKPTEFARNIDLFARAMSEISRFIGGVAFMEAVASISGEY